MKAIPYFVVGLLLLSGFAALGADDEAGEQQLSTISLNFSNLKVKDDSVDSYIQISIDGAQGCTYYANEPIMPMNSEKITLPFGTKILNIDYQTGPIDTMVLTKKIEPAPQPVIKGIQVSTTPELKMNQDIYESEEFYPDSWVKYYTGGGLDENNEHKTFLIIQTFPVRYSPATDTIQYTESIDLTITYEQSTLNLFTNEDDYKLVIITPPEFSNELEKLVTHKEGIGITTTLKTTDSIYNEFTGVDKPEQIKYFIKYAVENWGTEYVLLVGGLKSLISGVPRDDRNQGTQDWYLPVRYTNLKDDPPVFDPGYISDLYYADLYDSEGNFSSWDSDGDGIFAKWDNTPGRDTIDHYPDVHVGRLPCRNKFEVKIMVNKIINYEKEPAGEWYNKIIAVAGDSHDDSANYNFNEGELVTEKIINEHMSNYTAIKLYASHRESDPLLTPTTKNIIREISKGGGHLVFDGHGNPYIWMTYWPSHDGRTGGIKSTRFPQLMNGKKLPIAVIGGCHNSQFNVTIMFSFTDKDNSKFSWCHGYPTPECFGWWLVRKIGGGAIASIGNTGLGYGWVGGYQDLNGDGIAEPVCVEGLGGYLQILYYKTINEGAETLGQAHSGGISKYMDVFPPMTSRIDAKTVQQWALIGDPSLQMGG
jgi:hypothetical protein